MLNDDNIWVDDKWLGVPSPGAAARGARKKGHTSSRPSGRGLFLVTADRPPHLPPNLGTGLLAELADQPDAESVLVFVVSDDRDDL